MRAHQFTSALVQKALHLVFRRTLAGSYIAPAALSYRSKIVAQQRTAVKSNLTITRMAYPAEEISRKSAIQDRLDQLKGSIVIDEALIIPRPVIKLDNREIKRKQIL